MNFFHRLCFKADKSFQRSHYAEIQVCHSFHVEAGPMLALRAKGYDEFKTTVVDEDDISYKLDIKDNYKRIDAGIMCGAGMKLSKVPKVHNLE